MYIGGLQIEFGVMMYEMFYFDVIVQLSEIDLMVDFVNVVDLIGMYLNLLFFDVVMLVLCIEGFDGCVEGFVKVIFF